MAGICTKAYCPVSCVNRRSRRCHCADKIILLAAIAAFILISLAIIERYQMRSSLAMLKNHLDVISRAVLLTGDECDELHNEIDKITSDCITMDQEEECPPADEIENGQCSEGCLFAEDSKCLYPCPKIFKKVKKKRVKSCNALKTTSKDQTKGSKPSIHSNKNIADRKQ